MGEIAWYLDLAFDKFNPGLYSYFQMLQAMGR